MPMTSKWEVPRLGQVALVERTTVKPENIISGTTYIGMEHIDNNGEFKETPSVEPGELASNKFSFDERHVLYGKLRPYLKKIARPNFHGICSTDILPILPKDSLDKDYLYYFFRQPHMIEFAVSRCSGANLPRLSPKELAEFPIPLPPLEEQKRIAAILDKADAIRKKRKQAIELTEQFLRSAFLDMFGDPITNPKGWLISSIGELFCNGGLLVHKDGNYGGMYPRAHEFGDTGIPFLTAKCVGGNGLVIHSEAAFLNEDKANTFNYGWIETGDVLLAHNATVGRVALYHGDYPKALIGTSLTCFRPSQDILNSRFLLAMLRSDFFQRQLEKAMSQSTRNQVPITSQREMTLFIPPLLLQQSFGRVMDKAYRNHQHLLGSATQQKLLFNSLVQRAFQGEL